MGVADNLGLALCLSLEFTNLFLPEVQSSSDQVYPLDLPVKVSGPDETRSSGESPGCASYVLPLKLSGSSHFWNSSSRWASYTMAQHAAQACPQHCAPIFPHHSQGRAGATSQSPDRTRKQPTRKQHVNSPAAEPRRTSLLSYLPLYRISAHSSFICAIIHILICPSFIHS